jgi:hypothetical protein
MRQAARVTSIDALKDFKRFLTEFTTVANTALGEADADVRRTTTWVEHEQPMYWKTEIRKRKAKLAEAKNELFRMQVESQDAHVSATIQRRAVDRCEAALNEAETKAAACKRWKRLLDREAILYRGECQKLARIIEGEMPQAMVRMDKMIQALEQYVQLAAPTMDPKAGPRPGPDEEEDKEAQKEPKPPAEGEA